MTEALIQNAEFQEQRTAASEAKFPTSPVRPAHFKYYIHDSVTTLRFQLIGDMQAGNVTELNGSWETARSTLGHRRLVLDLCRLNSTDEQSRQWLLKMKDAGAAFLPVDYLEGGLQARSIGKDVTKGQPQKRSLLRDWLR